MTSIATKTPPRFNLIAAGGWDEGGPTTAARVMGSTDDRTRLRGLIAEAEDALARHGWPGRVWVTDAEGGVVPLSDLMGLMAR